MTREIRPLGANDISELSQFLSTGFHISPHADCFAPDVLRWKYLNEDEGGQAGEDSLREPRSWIARDESGVIIGHLGLCRTAFEGHVLKSHGGRVPTIHIIDWLGSSMHRAIGASLMRKAHESVPTQFGLGVSPSALTVGERIGYELRSLVPVYTRVIRLGYWLRTSGVNTIARTLRLAHGTTGRLIQSTARPRVTITLERISQFEPKIDSIVEQAKAYAILSSRNSARLNTMLRFPRQSVSGWHLRDSTGRLCGLALLNIVPTDHGRTRTGKIVDWLLDDIDVDYWHAALLALTAELAYQGADKVLAYASTPWAMEAACRSAYKTRFAVKFHIRDRESLIPRGAIFHLTPLEGDYAYT
jgi:hypothetical protein